MKSYLITDPKYYVEDTSLQAEKLKKSFIDHRPDFMLFRDKSSQNYRELAKLFLETCASFEHVKPMLHGDVDLAFTLGAYGVHLTSLQFGDIQKAKKLDLFTVVSCHSEEEILKAEKLGADAVTFSPIFSTPDKGEPKGLAELQRMVDKISLPIIALGGITTEKEVKAVESTGCYGFASIRYFVET